MVCAEAISLWILEVHEPAVRSLGLLFQHRLTTELKDLLLYLQKPLDQYSEPQMALLCTYIFKIVDIEVHRLANSHGLFTSRTPLRQFDDSS